MDDINFEWELVEQLGERFEFHEYKNKVFTDANGISRRNLVWNPKTKTVTYEMKQDAKWSGPFHGKLLKDFK
jgi:hypothetical protein